MKKRQNKLLFSKIPEKYNSIYHILEDANNFNYLLKFKSYCTEVLRLYQSAAINEIQFGYMICQAIEYPVFNDQNEIEEIINCGCMLELPKQQRVNNNHDYLKELINKIYELTKIDGKN